MVIALNISNDVIPDTSLILWKTLGRKNKKKKSAKYLGKKTKKNGPGKKPYFQEIKKKYKTAL